MAQRFLLCGTTGRKCAASRARTRPCFASGDQRDSLSIARVGLPNHVRCCSYSHRCYARVAHITTNRLLTLEAAATSSDLKPLHRGLPCFVASHILAL